jgi:hypothetical protein
MSTQSHRISTHSAHHSRRVEQTVLDHRIRQARRIALVVPRIAPAHRVQRPADIDPCAAAREQQVVIVLVLLRRRPVQRRALDGEDRRRVVRRAEDVAPEAVCRVLPAKREALREKIKEGYVTRFGSGLRDSRPGQAHTISSRQGASRHHLPYEPAAACSALYIYGGLCATHLRERMPVLDVRTRRHNLCPLQRHAQPVVHGSMPSLLNQIHRHGP